IGSAAIIGHNWPVFLRFNGGRGVLTVVGVSLILAPILALTLLAISFIFGLFKKLALGTITVITCLSIFSWFLPQLFAIERSLSLTIGFIVILLITIIRRLTAPKTVFTASVTQRQLLINRLLFDRDIRSREDWIKERKGKIK
ncbi:MAG: glycerol-3-phosphate acyltransferase, partial [Dehalococcoidales bacterium]|nr:glycerol-3-phosphate acyltransferase [Dehalococcoidales bacterium]